MLLPYTSGSKNGTAALWKSSINSSYMPHFKISSRYLYSICSQIDSFSSQPGVKALARPISNDASFNEAFTLYMDSFSSYRSLFFTLSYSFFFSSGGFSSLKKRTGPSRNSGKKYSGTLVMLKETAALMEQAAALAADNRALLQQEQEVVSYWNQIGDVKEAYWENVYDGVSGDTVEMDTKKLSDMLELFHEIVRIGITKACAVENGICPTYFSYEVTDYVEDEEGILPVHFALRPIPLFLEGPVRFFKLENPPEEKGFLLLAIKDEFS